MTKKTTIISVFVVAILLWTGYFSYLYIDFILNPSSRQLPTEQDHVKACGDAWESTSINVAVNDSIPEQVSDDNSDIPYFYTLPFWHKKEMNFVDVKQVKFGNEFEVYTKLMPWMLDMENMEIEFKVSEGLRIVEGGEPWQGTLKKCEVKLFNLKIVWDEEPDETQRIWMYFKWNFPRQAMLDYVDLHQNDYYDNQDLRADFIQFINEYPDQRDDSTKLIIN